jgi:pimeloyl-ACP methyl ester carboxylesterase
MRLCFVFGRWALAAVALASTAVACVGTVGDTHSSVGTGNTGDTPPGSDGGGGAGSAEIACGDAIDAIYGDPGALPLEKGAILRCAPDGVYAAADIQQIASDNEYVGKPLTSGARGYRILYRTERGDADKTAGSASALVLLPTTPRAAKVPALVFAHGTVGQAASCAPSKRPLSAKIDYPNLVALVGAGFPVIATDYAGYANYGGQHNPPSAYAQSADEGKSVLDALKAIRKLAPSIFSEKNVIVGHSQGGHAALSAHAMNAEYGSGGTLAATVAYSPLWFNQASWGAMLLLSSSFPADTSSFPIMVGIWYHYSHGELLDGAGHGVDVFAPDKRDQIKALFDSNCGQNVRDEVLKLGAESTDMYDPAFTSSVAAAAAGAGPCAAGDAVCKKWLDRYAADRPSFKGTPAASVPILLEYGLQDTTIPPNRAVCGFDRLKADNASVKFCVDANSDHGSILRNQAGYVNDWIASKTLGDPEPAKGCENDEKMVSDDAGAPVACATPPVND